MIMGYLTFKERHTIPDYLDPTDMVTGILVFDGEKCNRCGTCTWIGPGRSVKMDKKGKDGKKPLPYVEELVEGLTGCISCGCCLAACPQDAISIANGFRAGYFYTKLTQTEDLTYPKRY